ncbi:hypothetical protein SAMN05444397_101241 [Flavobacterium aquidurense]|uniref:Curlin associated repeat-containing protein n=1 Tax=Flavobacterium frigidimaris TaxID=262320 RepID=A0ABX4BNM2_FLAFR|nr:hypothetical protein [Flavobacterium frigidimaris]OXA78237.1 hypothetical protein B0A65_13810 [Flavobacterium frigidimaris]SDY28487.1 hypothetical protein SAMN05444397_101241 [Flavobacterium aquidurense]
MKGIVIIILFLSIGNMFSQSIDGNVNDYVLASNEINSRNQNQNTNQYIISHNIVKIAQIGNYNQANLTIISPNAYVTAQQTGNNNYMNVYKNADEINQSYIQSGNNNYISDVSLYSRNAESMKINQEGNNLTVFSSGSNSISKDMIINQSGNSGIIYVFNR